MVELSNKIKFLKFLKILRTNSLFPSKTVQEKVFEISGRIHMVVKRLMFI